MIIIDHTTMNLGRYDERTQHWLRRLLSALYQQQGVRSMMAVIELRDATWEAFDIGNWFAYFHSRMHGRHRRRYTSSKSCSWASFITSLAIHDVGPGWTCRKVILFFVPSCGFVVRSGGKLEKLLADYPPEKVAHVLARRARRWSSAKETPRFMVAFNSIQEEARRKRAAEALIDVDGMRDLIKTVQMYME
jgi:hypothetical protein